jgi:hypothetical protein
VFRLEKLIFNYDRLIFFNIIMSPIQDTNHEQDFYEFCAEFDIEIEQEQSSSIQQQDQSPEPPREFMIQRLFSIVSSIEITRHYANISVDHMEDMLEILDHSIKECEDYYGPYRNRHGLFFSIIDGAKEFLHFIREDQDRGLPSMDNQYI